MAQLLKNLTPNKTQLEIDQEFETKLIRTVFSLKWLYDKSHPDYSNATKNKLSWARIAHSCQRSLSECMNKWAALLQTYFSASVNWIHYEDFKKFEPHLHNNFRIPIQSANAPNAAQKDELLYLLMTNRHILFSPKVSSSERQTFWSSVTFKCNSIQPGACLGALEWKKYWYEMKQKFGAQRLLLQNKLRAMGTKLDISKYTDDDMKIIKICCGKEDDIIKDVITKALGSNIELGFNTELIIPKCVRCLKQQNQLYIDGYCETCYNIPSCDICHIICEKDVVPYKITEWSKIAKSLLPTLIVNNERINLCPGCSVELDKKATNKWKACRVCEAENPNLEYLFGANNFHLRNALSNATNVSLHVADGLPGYICKICKIQVQQLNNFYMKFCRTQAKLKTIHSVSFIGLSEPLSMNNTKAVNSNPNAKPINNEKDDINNIKSVTLPSSTISSSTTVSLLKAPVTVQLKQHNPNTNKTTSTTTSLAQFKRFSVQKFVNGNGNPDSNASEGNATTNFVPPAPPLAIKEIFSYQPTAPKPMYVGKPNIKVIPTHALQQAKAQEKISNVTKKNPQNTPKAPNNKQQTINVVNKINGNSVNIQPQNNPITLPRGFTIRIRDPTPQSEPNPSLNKQKEVDKIPSKVATPTTPAVANSALSTKPAIFTISDYETIEDAPPVFCIPKKNTDSNNTTEIEAEKQLMNFDPNDPSNIKTEFIEPGDGGPTERTTNLVCDPKPSVENIPGLPRLENQPDPPVASDGLKIIRLNGSMVAVKPHPHISGAYIPVDMNTKLEIPGDNRVLKTYIRKVEKDTFEQKSQTINKLLKELRNIPEGKLPIPRLPKKDPLKVVQVAPIANPQPVIDPLRTSGQGEISTQAQPNDQQYLQEMQPQIQQQGLKKPRKYWGNVDEFHVAPLPTQQPLPTPASRTSLPPLPPIPPPALIQKPNEKQRQPISSNKTPTSTEDPLNIQNTSSITIKEEISDDDDVSIIEIPSVNDNAPAMFYPDSIELEKLTFEADVSQMFRGLIQENTIINNNMSGSNFDKFLNPAYPISYEKKKKEDKVVECTEKDNKRNSQDISNKQEHETQAKKVKLAQEQTKENTDKNNKKPEPQPEPENIDKNNKLPEPQPEPEQERKENPKSPVKEIKMRQFRIKLKRSKSQIFFSRPKRLCTLQSRNSPTTTPTPIATQPPSNSSSSTVIKRKSLRLNQV